MTQKRILLAGKDSYIGDAFQSYLRQWPDLYDVTCVDMRSDAWRELELSGFDAVYMVAGIAHIKETPENRPLYFSVNRDLAVELAQKARKAGARQFVYLSSMSVYGKTTGVITPATPLNPTNAYGQSKAQAEELLNALETPDFAVTVLRPPMVYGKGCKGNYRSLEHLALKLPFFPRVTNQRSMLYIDNLSECVRLLIDRGLSGCFCPQNREYVCTWDMAKRIAQCHGKRLLPGYVTGLGVSSVGMLLPQVQKAFGTLIYQDTEALNWEYCVVDYPQSLHAMYP